MLQLIWIIVAIPLLFTPKKVLERPGCKIKTEKGVRLCGVLLIVLCIIQTLVHYL